MASETDSNRGLYGKFQVRRLDGKSEPGQKHEGCEYFVLDVTHDKHAHPALLAYADSCEAEFPLLARDLRVMAKMMTHRSVAVLRQDRRSGCERRRSMASETKTQRGMTPELQAQRDAAKRVENAKKKRNAQKSASANIARTGAKRGSFLGIV